MSFQPISVKEEADFRRLLARANLTIGEADKFATVLASQLQLLDGANIQSIMDSEAAVNDLITLVEDALEEVDFLDKELDNFDELLYVSTPTRFSRTCSIVSVYDLPESLLNS